MGSVDVNQDSDIAGLPVSINEDDARSKKDEFKWSPTGKSQLSAVEREILETIKTPFLDKFINIGNNRIRWEEMLTKSGH